MTAGEPAKTPGAGPLAATQAVGEKDIPEDATPESMDLTLWILIRGKVSLLNLR